MSEIDIFETGRERKRLRANLGALIAGVVLLIAIGLGVFFVVRFSDMERERDLRGWQARLGIVVESRRQAVDSWLEQQYRELGDLADNTSLKLYMTELAQAAGDTEQVTDEPAQRVYLRNLLIATAERAGFTSPPPETELNANVERAGLAGIALLNHDGQLIVATPSMPQAAERISVALTTATKGERALIDLFAGADGQPAMGFVLPIFPVQSEASGASLIGYVIGIKRIAQELYPLLKQPGATEASAEALLVRREEGAVRYLSPMLDGGKPLSRTLAASTPELAEAFAIQTPGGFGIKHDYRDIEVLTVARKVSLAPWTLVYKVDRVEALSDSDSRRRRILITFLLIIGVVSAAMIAVWFQASSRRSGEAARRFRELAERFEQQQKFLRLVTDSQPSEIVIVDEGGHVRFANKRLAEAAGVETGDLPGKTLAAVIGPVEARRIDSFNRRALESGATISEVYKREDKDGERVYQTVHTPLAETLGLTRSVLLVSEDITDAVTEREKRERIMHDLVNTLVTLVDRRDPYSMYHSTRVADVAGAMAQEMSLEPKLIETVQIAGSLMNLGKILVPEDLLTASRKLSREERLIIRNSILTSADLLEGIAFEGPVVETLRQMLEFYDGTGLPRQLKGEEILKTARICSVANAFVGMVSARAYREGMEFDKALDVLFAESGKHFDRSVVAALVNRLEHHDGRQRWADFRVPPTGVEAPPAR